MEWEPKDVFCVPSWTYHEHVNGSLDEPAVLSALPIYQC